MCTAAFWTMLTVSSKTNGPVKPGTYAAAVSSSRPARMTPLYGGTCFIRTDADRRAEPARWFALLDPERGRVAPLRGARDRAEIDCARWRASAGSALFPRRVDRPP